MLVTRYTTRDSHFPFNKGLVLNLISSARWSAGLIYSLWSSELLYTKKAGLVGFANFLPMFQKHYFDKLFTTLLGCQGFR